MSDDEDWDYEEESATLPKKKVQVIMLVGVLLIASVGSFLILQGDDDDFPSEAKAPKLHAGMDWWYQVEENIVDHQTGDNETDDMGHIRIGVLGVTSYGGKEAYEVNMFRAISETTRHTILETYYISFQSLNSLDDEGNEYVVFDFPLKDGKQWYWVDDDDNNRSYVCKAFKSVVTQDGTYDTYRIRISWSSENGDWRHEYRHDFYYSPELGYLVKIVERSKLYYQGDLITTDTMYYDLVVHGRSDSDGDGLSNTGEKWFGSDPTKEDTDSDGLSDLVDVVPLFDLGLSVNLTHVSTDEDVEPVEEEILGEEEGADLFFDMRNSDNNDELTTDPLDNTDSSELDIIYRIDLSDDREYFFIDIECRDADSGSPDDLMDITPGVLDAVLQLFFDSFRRELEDDNADPPENRLELDVEQEVYGNGNGAYDATLRFIVSEVDMGAS